MERAKGTLFGGQWSESNGWGWDDGKNTCAAWTFRLAVNLCQWIDIIFRICAAAAGCASNCGVMCLLSTQTHTLHTATAQMMWRRETRFPSYNILILWSRALVEINWSFFRWDLPPAENPFDSRMHISHFERSFDFFMLPLRLCVGHFSSQHNPVTDAACTQSLECFHFRPLPVSSQKLFSSVQTANRNPWDAVESHFLFQRKTFSKLNGDFHRATMYHCSLHRMLPVDSDSQ